MAYLLIVYLSVILLHTHTQLVTFALRVCLELHYISLPLPLPNLGDTILGLCSIL